MTVIRTLSLAPLALVLALALPASYAGAQEAAPGVPQGVDPSAPADRVVPLSEGERETDITAPATKPAGELPLEQLRRFVAVFDRIKRAYVEEVTDS